MDPDWGGAQGSVWHRLGWRTESVARIIARVVYRLGVLSTPGLFVFLIACGGGGGGGSTSSADSAVTKSSPSANPSSTSSGGSFRQTSTEPATPSLIAPETYWLENGEYTANGNLQSIRAASAYASGVTGAGQTIGFLDTGLETNHPEFADPSSPSGGVTGRSKIVYYNDAAIAATTSRGTLNHGTSVASIAAGGHQAGYGMQGVAFDASIAMWAVSSNSAGLIVSPSILMAAYSSLERAHAGVINNSWGTTTSYDVGKHQYQAQSMQALFGDSLNLMAQGSAIHVMAAGNEGAANVVTTAALPLYFSALSGLIVAVTSVDENGLIDPNANKCGAALAFCLAAPGGTSQLSGVTLAANALGGYRKVRGTSFSAAYVSGALALMKQKFGGQLSNQQYVRRLLDTARKDGAYARQSVYGQGLLDVYAAVTPVGPLEIPLPDGGSIPVGDLSGLTGVQGVPIPNVVAFDMIALDQRGDPFPVSLADIWRSGQIKPAEPRPIFAAHQEASEANAPLSAAYAENPAAASRKTAWNRISLLSDPRPSWVEGADLLVNQGVEHPDRMAAVLRLNPFAKGGPRIALGTEAQWDRFLGVKGVGAFSTNGVSVVSHALVSQEVYRDRDWLVDADLGWTAGKTLDGGGLMMNASADNLLDLTVRVTGLDWQWRVHHRVNDRQGSMQLKVPTYRDPDHTIHYTSVDAPINDTPQWVVNFTKSVAAGALFMQMKDQADNLSLSFGLSRRF